MTKNDFQEWKSYPITKAVFAQLQKRIYELQVELGYQAGQDSNLDNKRVGAIQAYQDLLDMDFEEETQ